MQNYNLKSKPEVINVTSHSFYNFTKLILYLKLNHAGRQRLLQGAATPAEWATSLLAVQDDVNGVYYLLQANPALVQQFLRHDRC